jgi:hypothetical protein
METKKPYRIDRAFRRWFLEGLCLSEFPRQAKTGQRGLDSNGWILTVLRCCDPFVVKFTVPVTLANKV